MEFTIGDVSRATGTPITTIKDWIAHGRVRIVGSGRGAGFYRRFKPIHVVAIAMADRLRRYEGWSLRGAVDVISWIGMMDPADLEAEFAAGRTHILPVSPLRLVSPSEWEGATDNHDVETVYRETMAALEEIAEQPTSNRTTTQR